MGFFKRDIADIWKDAAIRTDMSDGDYDPLPFYEGIFTIRNVTPDTSDDLFYFRSDNMIPGYIYADSSKTLDLVDDTNKLVISMVNSFYHSIVDNMSEAIYAMSVYPNHKLIIDVSEIGDTLGDQKIYHNAFLYFIEILKKRNIDYELVSLKKYDVIYMNNFHLISYLYETKQKANIVYEFFKPELTIPDAKPTKNVFISRSKAVGRDYSDKATGLKYKNDNRMDNHEALDKYFESMGYEVVHSEDFPSFQHQMDYFYEAKVVASITGSGLTNAIFMRPGQTLIEIVTPLVVPVGRPGQKKDINDPYFVQELHNFYKNIAFFKDHTYFAVQNEDRSFEKLRDLIESDKRIKAFLDRSNEQSNCI